jgi:hypothetical protein
MRDEGIDMPDPQVVKAGETNGIAGGGPVQVFQSADSVPGGATLEGPAFDPNSDEYKDADATCKPLLDNAIGDIKIDPEVEAEQRKQMLAFAKCMREHGIDFPDPTFQDGGGVTINIGGEAGDDNAPNFDPQDEDFQAASKECGSSNGAPFVVGVADTANTGA